MPPTVAELTEQLEAAGVDIPAAARKADLEALAAEHLAADGRRHVVGTMHVSGKWQDDDGMMRAAPRIDELMEVPAWYADSLVSTNHARLATAAEIAAAAEPVVD